MTVTPTPAFSLSDVSLQRSEAGLVLQGIDLEIPGRRVTALVGPSGSGKTSLLRLLNRLEEASGGEIRFRGRPLRAHPVPELRRRLGFIFQTPVLFPGTVRDNLRVAAELAELPTEDREARMVDALEAAGLDPALLDRPGERLSGGERQRVTIARALIGSPEVLLMDEPTSALDPKTADQLGHTVLRMSRERGLTVVLVTHRYEEARQTSDFTALLAEGRLVAFGPTPEVLGLDPSRDRTARTGTL